MHFPLDKQDISLTNKVNPLFSAVPPPWTVPPSLVLGAASCLIPRMVQLTTSQSPPLSIVQYSWQSVSSLGVSSNHLSIASSLFIGYYVFSDRHCGLNCRLVSYLSQATYLLLLSYWPTCFSPLSHIPLHPYLPSPLIFPPSSSCTSIFSSLLCLEGKITSLN